MRNLRSIVTKAALLGIYCTLLSSALAQEDAERPDQSWLLETKLEDNTFPVFADPNITVSKASAWGIGIDWYLNSNFKFVIDYEQTSFQGGSVGGNRQDERVIFTRYQISY
ncbi:MAG: hypothetical protein HYR76_10640 [Ignavibacteria bacterium]|nr:hypothetical protein [Ignavibacteria bacterium]